MPSKSPAQARLMAAAAHTPGGYGGVPQGVGKDFNHADKGGKMLSSAMANPNRRRQAAQAIALRKQKMGMPEMDRDKDGM
jgi:hypothetical protein